MGSHQFLHNNRHTLLEGVEDVLVGVGLAEAHPQVGDGVPGNRQLLGVVYRAEAAPPGLAVPCLLTLFLLNLAQKLFLLSLQALLRQGGSQQVCLQLGK